jgi:hypothetical protein
MVFNSFEIKILAVLDNRPLQYNKVYILYSLACLIYICKVFNARCCVLRANCAKFDDSSIIESLDMSHCTWPFPGSSPSSTTSCTPPYTICHDMQSPKNLQLPKPLKSKVSFTTRQLQYGEVSKCLGQGKMGTQVTWAARHCHLSHPKVRFRPDFSCRAFFANFLAIASPYLKLS